MQGNGMIVTYTSTPLVPFFSSLIWFHFQLFDTKEASARLFRYGP